MVWFRSSWCFVAESLRNKKQWVMGLEHSIPGKVGSSICQAWVHPCWGATNKHRNKKLPAYICIPSKYHFLFDRCGGWGTELNASPLRMSQCQVSYWSLAILGSFGSIGKLHSFIIFYLDQLPKTFYICSANPQRARLIPKRRMHS